MRLISWSGVLLLAAAVSVGISDARGQKAASGDEAQILAACPVQGDAKDAKARELNPLKRRMNTPGASDLDPKVSLSAILAPGEDRNRWDQRKAGVISGYVADVKVGGVESVNCHTKDPLYRDTHIEVVLNPNDGEDKYVIVEVTPQWREAMQKDGVDWTTTGLRKSLKGRWVTFTGWLLYDEEHTNAAVNSGGKSHIWRATVWELHPVTKIEVLPAKPAKM
jgi:hypothetical protein